VLRSTIYEGKKILENIISGNYSEVCCKMDGEYDGGGKYDSNGASRLLTAQYLLLCGELSDSIENVIANLMKEEISARQQDAYQGIGDCIIILTAMLKKLNSDGKYDELFSLAKNANFDCFCGYDPDSCEESVCKNISELSSAECIYMLADIGQTEKAAMAAEWYSREYPPKTIPQYNELIYINKQTGRFKENIPLYESICTMEFEKGDNRSISSVCNDLISEYIRYQMYDKAFEVFCKESECILKVEKWYSCGLGRDFLENAADLIIRLPENAEALWSKWSRFALIYPDRFGTNCLNKLIDAAELVGDRESAEVFGSVCRKRKHCC